MKIIHFVMSQNYAGIEQHIFELASEQMKNNDIKIICNNFLTSFYKEKFEVIEINQFSRKNFLRKYFLKQLLNKLEFDIIHTHGSKTTSIIASINSNKKYKHVSTIHNIKKNISPYNKSDHVIAVSDRITKGLEKKFTIITNWINFDPAPLISNFKKEDFAIAVGRLEKAKGFDLLINSWININMKLKVFGEGSEYKNLSKLIKRLSLENKISLHKILPPNEILKEYAKSKVLVVSSRNEGGPRVALEALALNTPVLSTDVGHMNKILPKELLAEPNNLKSLKTLLEQYVDNMNMLDQQAIFEFVRDEFSIIQKTKDIEMVYQSLLVN